MNSATLCGNVGQDIELRHTTAGKAVTSFSIATQERFKDRNSGEAKTVTDWHNIVLWSPIAEIAAKYLKKGSKVLITGKIKTRVFEHNGQKKTVTEIVGDNLELLDSRPAQQPTTESSGHSPADNSTDDLPF